MLCGHIRGRSFTHAFEQMRLDNTASIACGTFVQIRTQIPRPSMHPYRHMSGISERYICEREVNKRKLSIIRQVLPASSPSKPARKCIALPRTLNSACPGSVTLHPKKCNKAKQNRVFASVTLSGTTVPHEAQRRRKGVDFHGKGEPRFRATRREKRGKQQRSVSGFPLKQAKNEKADAACLAPAFILFVFHLNQARQNRILQALPLKCAVRIFRMSEIK